MESRSCQANFTPRKVKNIQLFAKSFFPTLFASFKCLCSFVWGKAAATVITIGKQISKWGMMHDAHVFTVVCFVFTLIHYCTLILFTCACGHIACKVQHSHKEYEINAVSLWQTAARKMQLSISWKMHFYKPFFFFYLYSYQCDRH